MPYINQLQAENAELRAKLEAAQQRVTDFMVHLGSPKFTGTDADGSRKDWIATSDVQSWLQEQRSALVP